MLTGSGPRVCMTTPLSKWQDTTWGTHPADEKGCEALSSRGPHMRTPEIHQKSSKINDLENEPGHVWRLPGVSGVTRDDI